MSVREEKERFEDATLPVLQMEEGAKGCRHF